MPKTKLTSEVVMQVRIGTSGYQYAFWRGSFYPEKLKTSDMLAAYARRFSTVELNNTFYRMPRREVLQRWADQVPDTFRFAIKAPQRITHVERLKPTQPSDSVAYLFDNLRTLGDKLGVVLFQLPPTLRRDLARLQAFFARLGHGIRTSFELRHESWNEPEVLAALRAQGAALCCADFDEGECTLTPTADFGYVRLRREGYDDAALASWAERIAAQPWREVFVYFKHEEAAPELAQRLQRCVDAASAARAHPPFMRAS